MTTGNKALVLEEGFVDKGQPSIVCTSSKLRDPCNEEECILTKESDREIIKKLSLLAENSKVFSCAGTCRMYLTNSLFWAIVHAAAAFGVFGLVYWLQSRNVKPGKGKIVKITPTGCVNPIVETCQLVGCLATLGAK